MSSQTISVRPCFQQDLEWVRLIYHHHVVSSLGTFEIEPPDLDEMTARWARICARGWPYLVAVDADDPTRVHGYAYAQQFRERAAYAGAFEDSVYVSPHMHRRGVGKVLLAYLLRELEELEARLVIAVIGDSANHGSIRLHAGLGFQHAGVVPDAGIKFHRPVDIVIMHRRLAQPRMDLGAQTR